MEDKDQNPADPEDWTAEIAAESTQESTPHKALYGDQKTRKTGTREPGKKRGPGSS